MIKLLQLVLPFVQYCSSFLISRRNTLQIEGPGNIPGTTCAPWTRDHKPAHARGLGPTLVALESNNDIMGLFTADALARFHVKARTVHAERELGRVREHVFKRNGCGSSCLDGVWPLRFRRATVAEQWKDVFTSNSGENGQCRPCIPQTGWFIRHFHTDLCAST